VTGIDVHFQTAQTKFRVSCSSVNAYEDGTNGAVVQWYNGTNSWFRTWVISL